MCVVGGGSGAWVWWGWGGGGCLYAFVNNHDLLHFVGVNKRLHALVEESRRNDNPLVVVVCSGH